MNILFVCSRNQWRSPTAETLYKNHQNHQVRSAGTSSSARIKVTAKLIQWADLIFVMEKRHKQRLLERFSVEIEDRQIIVLDIPDHYLFMDPELIDILQQSVSPYLKGAGE
ncbi:low molecular weight protein tyrosine phosphatase family protein [Spirosoma foliorum]|uniref:Protein tyrosine phosphatase n=1 Tax=Spirosoma foliorum TaxID=2710596 RepID=A0A7G5GQ22_9BACT|nr:protein tyrosine phosphatase [Spirosoma foliorum]QMW00964.1 protein tyrosine phosphatase [Spirosoma foliorum]